MLTCSITKDGTEHGTPGITCCLRPGLAGATTPAAIRHDAGRPDPNAVPTAVTTITDITAIAPIATVGTVRTT